MYQIFLRFMFCMYLLGDDVEYLGPVNLDINLTSLQSLKENIKLYFCTCTQILDAHVKKLSKTVSLVKDLLNSRER